MKYLILVVLATLLLGACSSAATPTATLTATQEPTPTGRPAATERPTAEPAATDVPPTTVTATKLSPTATQESQPVVATPTPPAVPSFLEVQPDDWVRGSADASVTIIEYSDFQ